MTPPYVMLVFMTNAVKKNTPTPPALLNREQAASRLGISVTEFRRRQRLGEFRPVKKGEKNELLFSLGDIEIAREKGMNMRAIADQEYTNEEASVVFAALAEGKSAVHCVVELHVAPRAVEAIVEAYTALTGGLWIPATMVAEFNKMPLDGPMPIKTPGDFKDVIEAMLAATQVTCMECNKRPRQVCKPCFLAALNAMKKRMEEEDNA